MHKFLRAVGFSKITKEELNDIFQKNNRETNAAESGRGFRR